MKSFLPAESCNLHGNVAEVILGGGVLKMLHRMTTMSDVGLETELEINLNESGFVSGGASKYKRQAVWLPPLQSL